MTNFNSLNNNITINTMINQQDPRPSVFVSSSRFGPNFDIQPSIRLQIEEPVALDDGQNWFAGRNPDSKEWMGNATYAFGRGNIVSGYLGFTCGHNNFLAGVASVAYGAGNATGQPTDPFDANKRVLGYCSAAFGKENWAYAIQCLAVGFRNRAFARAGAAIGYYCQAGDEAGTDTASMALGYRAVARGMYGGNSGAAVGSNLIANNGSYIFGSGLSEGNPYNSPNGQHVIGLVARGKSVVLGVTQPDTFTVYNGYGTETPRVKHDLWHKDDESVAVTVSNGVGGVSGAKFEFRGIKGDGSQNTHKLAVLKARNRNGGTGDSVLEFWVEGGGLSRPSFRVFNDGTIEAVAGVCVYSPNGTRYKISVSDAGALTAVVAPNADTF